MPLRSRVMILVVVLLDNAAEYDHAKYCCRSDERRSSFTRNRATSDAQATRCRAARSTVCRQVVTSTFGAGSLVSWTFLSSI